MWVFTKYGFFSGTCTHDDNNIIQIRGRVKKHLENLKKRFDISAKIKTSTDTDYKYRMFVPKDVWADILLELGKETDYNNFKNKVEETSGNDEYYGALMDIWYTMYCIQKRG